MRRAIRTSLVLLIAYLLQTTALPYLKIGGVMLDLIVIAVFTVGFTLGAYAGVAGGLLMALLMEVLTGELSGLTSVICISVGSLGVFVEARLRGYEWAGKRRRERLVKWLAPSVAIGLLVAVRELIYIVYFYLTGVEIRALHFFRMLLSGILASFFSLGLLPLIGGFLVRKPESTFIGKRMAKWRKRGKPKAAVPTISLPEIIPVEGGLKEDEYAE